MMLMQTHLTSNMLALQGSATRKEPELKQAVKHEEVKTKAAQDAQRMLVQKYEDVAERNHLKSDELDFAMMSVSTCSIVADA